MMRELLDEMVVRPVDAFRSVVEMLSQQVESGQRIDAIFSRFAHALSSPWPAAKRSSMTNEPSNYSQPGQVSSTGLSDEDRLILDRVEGALADGVALKGWW
jgi:hypothetical protein